MDHRLAAARDLLDEVSQRVGDLLEHHRAGRVGYITREWGFMTPGGLGGPIGGKFASWENLLRRARTFFPDVSRYGVLEDDPTSTRLPVGSIESHQHEMLPGNRGLNELLCVPPNPAVELTAEDLHDYRDASRLFILIGSLAHLASNSGPAGQPVPEWIAQPLHALARRLEVEPALSGHFMVVDNWQWRPGSTRQAFGVDEIELLYPAFGHRQERTYHTIPGCMAYALRGLPHALHELLCTMRDHAGERLAQRAGEVSRRKLLALLHELSRTITQSKHEFQRISTLPSSRTHVSKHVFIRHMQPFHKGLALANPDGSVRTTKGMSGLHFVSYHLLDAVLGRYQHGQLGELAKMEEVDAYYPRPQREFSACLSRLGRDATLRGFLDVVGADAGLRHAFNQLIECYAGESGVLAAHSRKLFSYMHNNVQVDTSAEGAGARPKAAPTPAANHATAMRMFGIMNEAVRERRRLRVSPLYARATKEVVHLSEDGSFAIVDLAGVDGPLHHLGSDVVRVLLPRERQSAEELCGRYFDRVGKLALASLESSPDTGWGWADLWESLGWPEEGVSPIQVCEFIEGVRPGGGTNGGPLFEPVSPRVYSACGTLPDRLRLLVSRPMDGREHHGFSRMADARAISAFVACAPGKAFLLPPAGSNLVMVAGGTGVSPFVSLAGEIGDRQGSYTLIHQARSPEAFLTNLEAWRAFTRANAGAMVMGFLSGQPAVGRKPERYVVAGGEIVEHRRLDSEAGAYYFLDERVFERLRTVTQPTNNFAYCCGGVQSTVVPMRQMLARIGREYEFEIQSYGGERASARGARLFKVGNKLIDLNQLGEAHPGGVRIIEQMMRLAHPQERAGSTTIPDLSAPFFELHPHPYNLLRLVNAPSDGEFLAFATMIEKEAERGVVFDQIAHQYVAAALAFPAKLNIVKIALKLELVALAAHLKEAGASDDPSALVDPLRAGATSAAVASATNCLNHIEDLLPHVAADDPDRVAIAGAAARAREQLASPAFVFDARTSTRAPGGAGPVGLELQERAEGEVMVLSLAGRLDAVTSAMFRDRWQSCRQRGFGSFVVDFANLDYISSMGLRVLLVVAKESRLVVCRMNPFVGKVFELGGFARYMKAHQSVEDALDALSRG